MNGCIIYDLLINSALLILKVFGYRSLEPPIRQLPAGRKESETFC